MKILFGNVSRICPRRSLVSNKFGLFFDDGLLGMGDRLNQSSSGWEMLTGIRLQWIQELRYLAPIYHSYCYSLWVWWSHKMLVEWSILTPNIVFNIWNRHYIPILFFAFNFTAFHFWLFLLFFFDKWILQGMNDIKCFRSLCLQHCVTLMNR